MELVGSHKTVYDGVPPETIVLMLPLQEPKQVGDVGVVVIEIGGGATIVTEPVFTQDCASVTVSV